MRSRSGAATAIAASAAPPPPAATRTSAARRVPVGSAGLPAPSEAAFDEFGLEAALPEAPEVAEPAPTPEAVEELAAEALEEPEPAAPPEPSRPTASIEIGAPADPEFVSYEELGSLLEEEMQKAGETAGSEDSGPAPVLDEQSLFADEQQFFNLAEELEKELSDEAQVPEAPTMAGPEGEASLEEIFREFKKGVEQQLSAEDYETHFNLGIAYKEMGLTDEAIGEFQLASKDPARMVECCSMLGLCFLEKGMPQLAVKWYRKGLEAPDIKEVETVGLLYDLGCVYQDTGRSRARLPDVSGSLRAEHQLPRCRQSREGTGSGQEELIH